MARKGGLNGATLRSGYLRRVGSGTASSTSCYVVPLYEAERLVQRAVMWCHSMKRVLSEALGRVGSGTASSASRYYCKGKVCDQFFTTFNDTQ